MDLNPNPKQTQSIPYTRRSTFKANSKLKSQKTRRLSKSIDEDILKAYGRVQSIKHNPDQTLTTRAKCKKIELKPENFKSKIKKLPDIKNSITPSNKLLEIKTKEEKLNTMIDSFIVTRSTKPRYTRVRDNIRKSLEMSKDDLENLVYEKNIICYRGGEMNEYKNCIQKNIKIEKFRSQNHKRLKSKQKEM